MWKVKEKSWIRVVWMDNLRGLLGIKRISRMVNAWVRHLCDVKEVDERIEEDVFQWFDHIQRMESSIQGSVWVVLQQGTCEKCGLTQ